MRRLSLSLALLAAVAAVAAVAGSATYSSYSETRTNAASAAAQSVFPPLSTTAPTASRLLTLLTGGRGTWNVANPATTTYTLQWQRCTAGTCTDVGPSSLLDVNNLLGTLVYTITGADSGSTLRLKVTARDTSLTPTAPSGGNLGVRNTTVAYSSEFTP